MPPWNDAAPGPPLGEWGRLWANAADKLQALIETMVELIEEPGGSTGHA